MIALWLAAARLAMAAATAALDVYAAALSDRASAPSNVVDLAAERRRRAA